MLALCCVAAAAVAQRVVLELDVPVSVSGTRSWQRQGRAPAQVIRLLVVLRKTPDQLQQLHDTVMRVSDPRSSDYGAHLTQQQLQQLVAPPAEAHTAVKAWLAEHGADRIAPNQFGDLISFDMTVAKVETMLNTQLFTFIHRHRGDHVKRIIRAGAGYSVPAELAPFIWLVADLLQFPALPDLLSSSLIEADANISDTYATSTWPADCGKTCAKSGIGNIGAKVTPAVLAQRYNLGSPPAEGTTNGSIAVAEFTGVFW